MSHTSQRRGLDPSRPGEEIVVLAMIPKAYKEKPGIHAQMQILAAKIMERKPHLWISHNFADLDIPQLGSKQSLLRAMNKIRPEKTREMIFQAVAEQSSVITAIYTDIKSVQSLLLDLRGEWLQTNRERGLPISIVLSGLFGDVRECCAKTGAKPHTYLHSLGFRGKGKSRLPDDDELELITMCGHGLISLGRVERLARLVKAGHITAEKAAENIARPCVCGIVNKERASKVLERMAEK